MDLDESLMHAEESMEKAVEYLKSELRGVRTGRASTGLVDFIKIDYYGSPSELRQLALVSVPEATQILVKPYDASSVQTIVKGIQEAGLGLNPVADGKQVRINIPPLSGDRRKQLMGSVKQMGEQAKIAVRNARRDGNKHLDQAAKDKDAHVSEDAVKDAKDEMQELLKKYEGIIEKAVTDKQKEIEQV